MSTTTTLCPNCSSSCIGVIASLNQTVTYECNNIFIPSFLFRICANCACNLQQFKILTLPTKGVLKLNNVNVAVNQAISPSNNGKLVYVKDSGQTGSDTFTYRVETSCGNSTSTTITINIVECSANPCCC